MPEFRNLTLMGAASPRCTAAASERKTLLPDRRIIGSGNNQERFTTGDGKDAAWEGGGLRLCQRRTVLWQKDNYCIGRSEPLLHDSGKVITSITYYYRLQALVRKYKGTS